MAATNTTEIVLVAFIAGKTEGVPEATSTLTLRRINSAAISGELYHALCYAVLDGDALALDVAKLA